MTRRQATGQRGTGDPRPTRSGMRKFLAMALVVAVFAAFAVVVGYAYREGLQSQTGETMAPLIKADTESWKVRPETPGGMEVPHQDKLVYGRLAPEDPSERVERLLPPPEEPLVKRQPLPPLEVVNFPDEQPVTSDPAGADPAPTGDGQEVGEGEAESPGVIEPGVEEAESGADVAEQVAVVPETTPQPPEAAEPAAASSAEQETLGPYRVQVASLKSPEAAERAWKALVAKYPDLLGSLRLIVERIDLGEDKGIYYRAQGGPIDSRDAATDRCTQLRTQKVNCIVVKR